MARDGSKSGCDTRVAAGRHRSGPLVLERLLSYTLPVPRPRRHDIDALLDVAEELATSADPAGLTLRALARAAAVSNGSIYHAFTSKDDLLARMWLRTAQRFLALQAEAVDHRLAGRRSRRAGVEALVAAARSPAEFGRRHPAAARLFFTQRRDQLFSTDLPPDVLAGLEEVQERFTATLVRLAEAVWGRRDRTAVEAATACVVDLPGGLVRRTLLAGAGIDELTETRIEAAVEAIAALPLPAPPPPTGDDPATTSPKG